jgi:Flp pilus assembly pilin Flp
MSNASRRFVSQIDVTQFLLEEAGASLAEYLVMIGVVTLVVAGGIAFFSSAISGAFQTWGSWINANGGP